MDILTSNATANQYNIIKLISELTLISTTKNDLGSLLEHLIQILQQVPTLQIRSKGIILMFNQHGQPVRVAQLGLSPLWMIEDVQDDLQLFSQPPCNHALVTSFVSTNGICEQICVLPLYSNNQNLGQILIYTDPHWTPQQPELELLTNISKIFSGIINQFLLNATIGIREIELEDARTDAIRRLGAASEYRDNETGMHIMRMTNIAGAIAKAMGIPPEIHEMLLITAPMHDVGKIGISDSILLKPERLAPDEFEIMKGHTEIGAQLLKGDDALIVAARDIALYHHENWDGSGYPNNLSGEQIPLLARICSLADVFDALMSKRPYKPAWPLDKTLDYINSESGKKFDPAVVSAFHKALPEALRIRELYREEVIDPTQPLHLPELPSHDQRWISWDESLSVKIDVIDEHHRYLFDLVNNLVEVAIKKKGMRELGKVMKALEQYTIIHFQAEEAMMRNYGYQNLEKHIHLHTSFLDSLKKLTAELHINPIIVQFEALHFLRNWLVNHIKHEDTLAAALIT